MKFIGREKELSALNDMYAENQFHLFILYGRRRVGKTTLLNEFCKDKDTIFYSAEQSNNKLNLEKFSSLVFDFYKETTLEPFSSWNNALTYINDRQKNKPLVLVLDEFPYLVKKNRVLLSELQHLIDHKLKKGKLFIVLCGSYMGFMEKEVLSSKSPLFGRRTGQLHMKPFDYTTSIRFLEGFTNEEKIELYGAFGGTPLYLEQIQNHKPLEYNIRNAFLKVTSYLYEEPLLLLRQEVNEPGVYSAIIEAIAGGYSKSNEIASKIGEETAKCLKYISTLCELGILYKEAPIGEKESTRRTVYGISDLMFRFWYRYVFSNRTLIETGSQEAVYKNRIKPDYSTYMGLVFELVCKDYLLRKNATGQLPFLFTSIGRWWGTNPTDRSQIKIDLVANSEKDYIFCECKWTNEPIGTNILNKLKEKTKVFSTKCQNAWFVLFSKNGFNDNLKQETSIDKSIILVSLDDIINIS